MHLLDLTLPTLAENIALDEALLLDAEAGGAEVLRFWEWRQVAVVLGAGGRLESEVHIEACAADGVPIVRRSSGGGAVLIGAGCLNYSLVLSFERDAALGDLHASYRYILGRIQRGLASDAPVLTFQGISDLTLGDRKCSGNAQQRKRTHLLHHGTLLYAFDATPMTRYLKGALRQPEYRHGRAHVDFVTNLGAGAEVLKTAMANVWQGREGTTNWPEEMTRRLVGEKYGRTEWTRRR